MAKKSVSDGYLSKLWRQAVLTKWDYTCPYCGQTDVDVIECHHIVKRRNVILRWDVNNGVPGCKYSCHMEYHTQAGQRWIEDQIDEETLLMLDEYERTLYKNYLQKNCLTDGEFRRIRLSELKKVINGG